MEVTNRAQTLAETVCILFTLMPLGKRMNPLLPHPLTIGEIVEPIPFNLVGQAILGVGLASQPPVKVLFATGTATASLGGIAAPMFPKESTGINSSIKSFLEFGNYFSKLCFHLNISGRLQSSILLLTHRLLSPSSLLLS